MIKFEEHDGQLFRMLEEPVQLKEKNTNVLVQFITHGVIGEYVMEHWLDCGQENAPIFVDSVDSDGDVIVFIENSNKWGCPFPMFEIIGIFVVEGSEDWALYQMMQGKMVCHETSPWDWYRMYNDHAIQNRTVGYMDRVSAWLESTVQSGWQIYKEPETDKEPIADCDNCKHRCAKNNIDYCQMYEPKPEPQYKVGDWVEWHEGLGTTYQSQITRISHSAVYSKGICIPLKIITRKLKPSEVVVRIGCLEGTVEDLSYADNGRFFLIGKSTERHPVGMYSILYDEMLDTQTRELVESLLEAMQGEEK